LPDVRWREQAKTNVTEAPKTDMLVPLLARAVADCGQVCNAIFEARRGRGAEIENARADLRRRDAELQKQYALLFPDMGVSVGT
jgi:hypothetical protein